MKTAFAFIAGCLVTVVVFFAVSKMKDSDTDSQRRLPPAFDLSDESASGRAYEVLSVWYRPETKTISANLLHSSDWKGDLGFWANVYAAILQRLIYFYHTLSEEMPPEEVYGRLRTYLDRIVADMLANKQYPSARSER